MITPEKRLMRYCTNFQEIENYQEAVQSTERYELHHRKEIEILENGSRVLRSKKELKDLDLYWNRPAEELIFLKECEHKKLHNLGKKYSGETKAKLSAAISGYKNPMYGRIGDKNPYWKGGISRDRAKYKREWRRKRRLSSTS